MDIFTAWRNSATTPTAGRQRSESGWNPMNNLSRRGSLWLLWILCASFTGAGSLQAAVTGITATVPAASQGVVDLDQFFDDPGKENLPTITLIEFITSGGGDISGGQSGVAWWDIEITVNVDEPGNTTIGIDKEVFNDTGTHWDDFHFTIGSGTGEDFEPSSGGSGLFFAPDPPPMETTGFFDHPPMVGEFDESLWWMGGTGIKPSQAGIFWAAVGMAEGVFMPINPQNPWEGFTTTFTLREHATTEIPEPQTYALLGTMLGFVAYAKMRRKREVQ